MNDYKELIYELKELSDEEKEFASNSGDIYLAENLALAADAIEHLVKERDAAVAVLELVCNSVADSTEICNVCKKDGTSSCYAGSCAWEWRGLEDNDDKID